jgi:hypothetical protein
VRVGGLRVGIAGDAAAVEAERRHGGLADDVRAGVEQARDDGRVLGRDVALHDRRAVEHRDLRDADVVLDADRAAGEGAVRGAGDRAAPDPAVGLVLAGRRAPADVLARVLDAKRLVAELVEALVAGRGRREQRVEGGHLLVGQRQLERARDALDIRV